MSKPRTRRLLRLLTLAAAVGVTVLPAVPAHATYGPQFGTVHWQLLNSAGNQLIGSIDGTLEFDDGNTKFRYSLTFCRQNSFTAPYANVYVNGAFSFAINPPYTGMPSCGGASPLGGVATGEVQTGGVVQNVTVQLNGSYYGSGPGGYMVWEQRQKNILKDNPYNWGACAGPTAGGASGSCCRELRSAPPAGREPFYRTAPVLLSRRCAGLARRRGTLDDCRGRPALRTADAEASTEPHDPGQHDADGHDRDDRHAEADADQYPRSSPGPGPAASQPIQAGELTADAAGDRNEMRDGNRHAVRSLSITVPSRSPRRPGRITVEVEWQEPLR